MNVSLTKQQTSYVKDKVKGGRYGSASEVIREALRVLEQLEHDRDGIEQALDEADLEPAVEVKNHKKWFRDLREEMHRKHAARKKNVA